MRIYTLLIIVLHSSITSICLGQIRESKDTLRLITEISPGMERDKKELIFMSPKDITQTGVPILKGKPKNIKHQKEFFYPYNGFQYMFQNYCKGLHTRNEFVETAKNMNWNLADTLLLSRKPLKNGISILTGVNSKEESVYIVDANNNYDYSDEVVQPLKYNLNYDSIINYSVPVLQETYINNKILQEYILVFVDPRAPAKDLEEIGIVLPEYRFRTIEINRKYYTLWSPTLAHESEIYIYNGKKETLILTPTNPIKPGQYVTLGNTTFKYLKSLGNQKEIFLGQETVNLFPGFIDSSMLEGDIKFSSQIGFIAPPIKGIDINVIESTHKIINSESLRGKYIFLDFWSTTCIPCIEDFKNIKKSFEQFNRNEFQIIGIVDEQSKGAATKLMKKHGVLWPNIKTNTPETLLDGYVIKSYPTTFLIDPDGKVIFQNLRGDELLKKLNELIVKSY